MMFSSLGACRSANVLGLNLTQPPGRATPPLEGDGVPRDPHISSQWDLPQAEALKLQLCRCTEKTSSKVSNSGGEEQHQVSNTRGRQSSAVGFAEDFHTKDRNKWSENNLSAGLRTNGGCQLEGVLPVGGKNSRFDSSSLKR